MSIDLQLHKMTLAEKLEAMELIWADIKGQSGTLASPDWHRDILEERQQLVADGKMKFQDWDIAIAELKDELHGNSPT